MSTEKLRTIVIREVEVTDEKKIAIGAAALKGLEDRRGLRETLQGIRREDPELWREICLEAGTAALTKV
jgi:hypothetical protein